MIERVRLVRPWGPLEIDLGPIRFSTELDPAEADALLCEWTPTDELLDFDGPSAWYTCEPRTNPRMGILRQPDQRRFSEILRPNQQLHHAHRDPRYRVPHMTHASLEVPEEPESRLQAAVAVVSNYGGPIRNRWPDIVLRNAFATREGVHLFGRDDKWKHYRARWWSLPRRPATYRGSVTGEKIGRLTRYDVAICLENISEPWYFTEKFVDSVRSGCIPIYRAHPTVRDSILRGARWVDPQDFDLDPARTLEHALSLDREEVAEENYEWLTTDAVRETSERAIWSRIAEALGAQAAES